MAAKPVNALRAHQPVFSGVGPDRIGANPAQYSFCSPGSREALVVEEGAATARVRVPVAALVLVTLIGRDAGAQVTPGGKLLGSQLTLTVPVKPPFGVTVTVELALLPAATAVALPDTENDALLITVKVMGAAVVEVA